MTEFPAAAQFAARAQAAGLELRFGRDDLLDAVRPLWLSMLAHHRAILDSGLPMVAPEVSWPRRRQYYEKLLTLPETVIIVASRAGEPVGYCVTHIRPGPDDTWPTGGLIGEIDSVAVVAAERGAGIGTLLMDAAEAHLAAYGAVDVMLEVLPGNASPMAFYQRRGMKPATIKMLRLAAGSG
ncbi:MAG TPA: GNAT family N-acetyltransferase [Streptosporangiaceae bacterium]|jgi:ribosomal protein S18 acetylase RimI-like enzyme